MHPQAYSEDDQDRFLAKVEGRMSDVVLTAAEAQFLSGVLSLWVNEGYTTPPYEPAFYDVAEKFGWDVAPDSPRRSFIYDIRRPHGKDT